MGTPRDGPVILGDTHRFGKAFASIPGSGNDHVANLGIEDMSPTHEDLTFRAEGQGGPAAGTNPSENLLIRTETGSLIAGTREIHRGHASAPNLLVPPIQPNNIWVPVGRYLQRGKRVAGQTTYGSPLGATSNEENALLSVTFTGGSKWCPNRSDRETTRSVPPRDFFCSHKT